MAAVNDEDSQEKRPGIIYFSRLPPFMKPAKVRYLFAQYGDIGRLFLQPEGTEKVVLIFGLGVHRYVSRECDHIVSNIVLNIRSIDRSIKLYILCVNWEILILKLGTFGVYSVY